jgi:hypothetical protein
MCIMCVCVCVCVLCVCVYIYIHISYFISTYRTVAYSVPRYTCTNAILERERDREKVLGTVLRARGGPDMHSDILHTTDSTFFLLLSLSVARCKHGRGGGKKKLSRSFGGILLYQRFFPPASWYTRMRRKFREIFL